MISFFKKKIKSNGQNLTNKKLNKATCRFFLNEKTNLKTQIHRDSLLNSLEMLSIKPLEPAHAQLLIRFPFSQS